MMAVSSLRRIALLTLIAGGISLTFQDSARATNDGGGRSVFAYGAGNRALSLGGAYAALANDASAPIWNAGGLGLVGRREFQVSYTNYYGLDIDEQYASIVLPSWRWGTFSLTFRRFAVNGIERRDDRNVLLQEDLSDNETEFLVGYGKSVGNAFSIGSTLKLQRQSLAGFSGSGVGLDLGVIVHPLVMIIPNSRNRRQLSVGLSFRNAVEPKIRLMEAEVPDPTGVRLGLAYVIPFSRDRTVLASFDLEKTKKMNTCLHVGLELHLNSLLALRAGVADGVFNTGTGIQLKGVTIDYTFESGQIDNVHRFGASFSFGPTVEQSRQAALEAQEKKLQARLAISFEKRQAERIRELLSRAAEAQSVGNYEEALEILAVITALEPEYKDARTHKVQCLLELGKKYEYTGDYATAALTYSRALDLADGDPTIRTEYDRCRAESDRQAARSEQIRQLFAISLDAFSSQDLVGAKEGFNAVLQVAPEDREAAEMLQRTIDAIDLRVSDLLRQANNLIEWGHLEEAGVITEEAKRLDPKSEMVRFTISRLTEAKNDEEKYTYQRDERESADFRASAVPDGETAGEAVNIASSSAVEPLTEERKREIRHLHERGIKAMSENHTEDAIRYFEFVWSIDPDYQSVALHLKRLYLMNGMEYFADGKLDKAVQQWENVLKVDPADEQAIGYLSRAREQVARTQQILGEKK